MSEKARLRPTLFNRARRQGRRRELSLAVGAGIDPAHVLTDEHRRGPVVHALGDLFADLHFLAIAAAAAKILGPGRDLLTNPWEFPGQCPTPRMDCDTFR